MALSVEYTVRVGPASQLQRTDTIPKQPCSQTPLLLFFHYLILCLVTLVDIITFQPHFVQTMLASEDEDLCSFKENQTKALRSSSDQFKLGITSKNGAALSTFDSVSSDHHSQAFVDGQEGSRPFIGMGRSGETFTVPGWMARLACVPFSSSHLVLHCFRQVMPSPGDTQQNDTSWW